ncbi:MAG TPA: hypothetical protein VI461_04600 [Chitinophagaceae bacterium]|nr:hypothetical protein [Chitinophagaceae bacterium]
MKKILLSLIVFSCLHAYSQTCAVAVEALKGTYEGDCKKDKADGAGTAKGEDSYTGGFKNGYPDGKGRYMWKNGDWYYGEWKKGLREGHGAMHYAEKAPGDSAAGFWKKDKYIGKYEKPYVVTYKTRDIYAPNVVKENDTDKELLFTIKSSTGGAVGIRGQMDKVAIADLQVIHGNFVRRYDDTSMPKTATTTLYSVVFPIKMKITFTSEDVLEMEILEEGKYSIEIKINK